jgi:hypothetical protein
MLAAVDLLDAPGDQALQVGLDHGLLGVCLLDQLAATGVEWHLTVVDPDGVTSGDDHDAIRARLEVNPSPEVFWHNLRSAGYESRGRILEGEPGESSLAPSVRDRTYGMVLVFAGLPPGALRELLTDIWTIAEPGALVVLAAYREARANVARVVDEIVDADVGLERLGTVGAATVLRVR